jgi:hypothetical protein
MMAWNFKMDKVNTDQEIPPWWIRPDVGSGLIKKSVRQFQNIRTEIAKTDKFGVHQFEVSGAPCEYVDAIGLRKYLKDRDMPISKEVETLAKQESISAYESGLKIVRYEKKFDDEIAVVEAARADGLEELEDPKAVAERLQKMIRSSYRTGDANYVAKLSDTYIKIIRAVDELDERKKNLLPAELVREAEVAAAAQTCAAFDRIAERGRIAAGLSQEQAVRLRDLIMEERFALRERLLSESQKILTGEKKDENRNDETGVDQALPEQSEGK